MAKSRIFIDRRRRDRRTDPDPCKQMPMDLYHRKRRKSEERRQQGRNLLDDYQAYTDRQASLEIAEAVEPKETSKN